MNSKKNYLVLVIAGTLAWIAPAGAGLITAGSDLFVGPVEVTQGIQNWTNAVRLVKNKSTVVRFNVAATGAPGPDNDIDDVEAVLNVVRIAPGPATFLGVLHPINPGGTIDVKETPARSAVNDSFLFELPYAWRNGTLRITAFLDPLDKLSESNESNNDAVVEVNFVDAPPVRVRLYDVSHPFGALPSDDDHSLFRSWMRAAYPTTALLVEQRTLATFLNWTNDVCNCSKDSDGDCTSADVCANDSNWPCEADTDCGCGRLNNQLVGIRALEEISNPGSVDPDRRYVGWVDESPGFMRGCSPGETLKVASGPTGTKSWNWDFDGSYADWYTGHELGHAYGRPHAPCCNASGTEFYPYPMCRLSDGAQSSFWGYDSSVSSIYNPNQYTDIMSYCDFQWMSDFTYEAILDQLILEGGAPPPPPPSGPGDFVMITGTGNLTRGTLKIRTAKLLRGVQNPFPAPSAGTHILQLRDSTGSVLASHAIAMQAYENDQNLYPPDLSKGGGKDTLGAFLVVVPFAPGTADLVILQGATAVASLHISNNPPVVNITTPNGGEVISSPTTVQWTMSDLDGDTLSSDVFYSPDSGTSWLAVAAGVPGTSAQVDLQGLPGGNTALFRVITSDGFLTDSDESDAALALADQFPAIEITAPGTGSTYPVENEISLESLADDPEDGPLAGASIVWSSDRSGVLGTGENLLVRNLRSGRHVITATATDSAGNSSSDSIRIVVERRSLAPAVSLPFFLPLALGLLGRIAWVRLQRA